MIKELETLGLSLKESEIYLALAKEGQTSANKLSEITNTNRTVAYNILKNLLRKGLISFVVKKSRRVYQISNFDNLLANIKEKEFLAKEVISQLNKLKPSRKEESEVEIYEGKEGIRIIHKEMLNASSIRILNATGLIQKELELSIPLLKEFLKKEVKIIANKTFKIPKKYKRKKTKIKYLPQGEINYATTFIFKDTVIIQILKRENFLVVKIKNKALFRGFKMNFDLLWKFLR